MGRWVDIDALAGFAIVLALFTQSKAGGMLEFHSTFRDLL